jgi:long-chain acyl-CoA synthetase
MNVESGYMVESIVGSVLAHSEEEPDKPAIIAGKEVISYSRLRENILAAAHKLQGLGVRSGDRVMLSAAASPSFIYGYLAAHLLQAIAVPVDSQSTEFRLKYIIEQARPKAVFLAGTFNSESVTPVFSIRTLEELPPADVKVKIPSPGAIADILYTTGTTGEPKGVVLTHETIRRTAYNINTFIGNSAEDREVIPLPLSHSFGLGRLRCNLLSGATVILVNGFAFIGNIFRAIENFGASGLSTVPAGIAMLFRFDQDKIGAYADQLKYMEIGSAPMPLEHKQKLIKLLPKTRICMHYGLTEASRSTFIEFHSAGEKLENSIGIPAPNVKVKIVDNHFRELPPGQIGRILVKGENVMQEYFENKKMTEETFASDWLYTGDYGCYDEDGYFYLEAREKEMINVGGLKVSPVEIEDLLKKHECIADCACVGIRDPKGISGEAVKACMVKKTGCLTEPNFAEIVDFLKNRIETYKIPIQIQWINAIPKTSSGKIQRLKLKQRKINCGSE